MVLVSPSRPSMRNSDLLNGRKSHERSSNANQLIWDTSFVRSQAWHSASRWYPTSVSGTFDRSQYFGVTPSITLAMSGENLCRIASKGGSRRQVLVTTTFHSGACRSTSSRMGRQQKCFDSWQCSGCRTPSKSRNRMGMFYVVNGFPTLTHFSKVIEYQ